MKRILSSAALAVAALAASASPSQGDTIVKTDAYSWHGDTITQGQYFATAPSATRITSTYHAQPGYFMPVEQEWVCRNDLSPYPALTTGNMLHNAIYNMGLDEMINNVEPDTTLRTGKEWAGVWTRDVSYSIILSMAYLQPEASKISLMKKVDSMGRIIQDTGSGGAWPVSSDRMIWAVAAYELYKVTGDRDWLNYIYPIIARSLEADFATVYGSGLVKGETSFIDWREQSYPRWMQTADIYDSEALGTSVVHYRVLTIMADIARQLGKKGDAAHYADAAESLKAAINDRLWMPSKGYYAMYLYGPGDAEKVVNPRAETLGESLAILFGVASADRARSITENNPVTPFGPAIFFPQIADMPPYHNNALWPFVASYWALANAQAHNEEGTLLAIGSVFRPAALFATNKENFVLDNGDIATELNSSNMLWSLAGNLAITYRILFGINFEEDGLRFDPFVPRALADTRTLTNFRYRDAILNITIKGYGDRIASFRVNGKETAPFIKAKTKGTLNVEIVMADNEIAPMSVNLTPNVKAPLTPLAEIDAAGLLSWQPIEYIAGYEVLRDGKVVATTRSTTFDVTTLGDDGSGSVYQVVGLSEKGVPSFASRPLYYGGATRIELPGATRGIHSSEALNVPLSGEAQGFTGNGYVEVDHKSAPVTVSYTVDGDIPAEAYISVRYANGNGPVNTLNMCGIRSLMVNGRKVGTIVLPHRGEGNWDDWGYSNRVKVTLNPGANDITIEMRPEDENMNIDTNHALIDYIEVFPISSAAAR